jgi:hypothetical protein
LGGGGFFLVAGFTDPAGDGAELEQLAGTVYDLAYFWKVDPELMMSRPLDVLQESLQHAQRISAAVSTG